MLCWSFSKRERHVSDNLSQFKIGQRFQFSSLGKSRNPRLADKVGVVIGVGRIGNSVRVRLDSAKSNVTFHRSYLEALCCAGEVVVEAKEAACARRPCDASPGQVLCGARLTCN